MNRILIGAERLMWKEVGLRRLWWQEVCAMQNFLYNFPLSLLLCCIIILCAAQLWCFHAASMLHFKYYFCLWLCAACSLTKSKMLLSSLSLTHILTQLSRHQSTATYLMCIFYEICMFAGVQKRPLFAPLHQPVNKFNVQKFTQWCTCLMYLLVVV